MIHAHSCGRVGRRAEDDVCGVEDFEAFSLGGINVAGHCGWVVGVGVGVGSLEKILSNQVWKVWVANLLAKTMQAVWVVWSCRQIG